MTTHLVGTGDGHLRARLELLEAERKHPRRGDELAAKRRALPWERIDKTYVFDTGLSAGDISTELPGGDADRS
jgi:predicted dithiol-disulfide oxidoreductase (DUF899 family)